MTTRLLFKVTNEDGSACHSGRGRWPLPTKHADGTWTPGAPLTVHGPLEACRNGLHLTTADQLIHWLGPAIWTVQVPEGVEEIDAGTKIVVRTARLERRVETWNERTARHFACDCAARVLHLTKDPRPAEAVRIARLFADGLATAKERAAAANAAYNAASAVGYAANAAYNAAYNAAGYAANAAYNAAYNAAGYAANAAYAAGYAAYAAGYAAGYAAYAAAERQWQAARLMQYLRGEAP